MDVLLLRESIACITYHHVYALPVQWKLMFSERFRLRRNWLNGYCNVRTFEGHTQGMFSSHVITCMHAHKSLVRTCMHSSLIIFVTVTGFLASSPYFFIGVSLTESQLAACFLSVR